MDVMTIKSKMLTGLISKIITKIVKKQLGQGSAVTINEVEMKTEDGKIKVRLNAEACISPNDLQDFLKKNDIL